PRRSRSAPGRVEPLVSVSAPASATTEGFPHATVLSGHGATRVPPRARRPSLAGDRLPRTPPSTGRSDGRPIDTLDEGGFARMRLPQRDGAHGERVVAVLAFGQRLQIGEQCDSGVILSRFPGGDQSLDARPRGFFFVGQFVESSFAGI